MLLFSEKYDFFFLQVQLQNTVSKVSELRFSKDSIHGFNNSLIPALPVCCRCQWFECDQVFISPSYVSRGSYTKTASLADHSSVAVF